jgi:hypothetical protein
MADAEIRDALNKLLHASKYLDRPTLSSEFAKADADAKVILKTTWQTLSEWFDEELLWRSLPRGEDR